MRVTVGRDGGLFVMNGGQCSHRGLLFFDGVPFAFWFGSQKKGQL